jgi:hypothetical protein
VSPVDRAIVASTALAGEGASDVEAGEDPHWSRVLALDDDKVMHVVLGHRLGRARQQLLDVAGDGLRRRDHAETVTPKTA